jgi:putative phosphoesterase
MKVALLGDVHANLPALEAVLAHAGRSGCSAIWNIGDWVGYGAFPDQVVQRLKAEGAVSIIGNYDLKVLKVERKLDKWRRSKHPLKLKAFLWAYQQLSAASREYLRSLPKERRFEYAGRRILLTHGSPVSNEEALSESTPQARLIELAAVADCDLIVCGHSHRPFARQAGNTWFVNTGSVGRPDDGDARASYASVQFDASALHFEHHRVDYDIARAVAEMQAHDLPNEFAAMLIQGRDLASIEAGGQDIT